MATLFSIDIQFEKKRKKSRTFFMFKYSDKNVSSNISKERE